jgi:hypothetical protein
MPVVYRAAAASCLVLIAGAACTPAATGGAPRPVVNSAALVTEARAFMETYAPAPRPPAP